MVLHFRVLNKSDLHISTEENIQELLEINTSKPRKQHLPYFDQRKVSRVPLYKSDKCAWRVTWNYSFYNRDTYQELKPIVVLVHINPDRGLILEYLDLLLFLLVIHYLYTLPSCLKHLLLLPLQLSCLSTILRTQAKQTWVYFLLVGTIQHLMSSYIEPENRFIS